MFAVSGVLLILTPNPTIQIHIFARNHDALTVAAAADFADVARESAVTASASCATASV